MLDEANAYERGMDDDLTFQTVRELAGTAYMAGRSAPPTDAEVEAVAKRLCWNSCEWDGKTLLDHIQTRRNRRDKTIKETK